ncbi:hydrogenase [Mycobacterium intracellulare]|uniref:Hydrogenase n=2 Tax=Mycobacterium TaxID=1763 RepID=A0AAD0E3W9_9MYCO|nr:hydrogenase [Mycobacterium marseillense]MCA2254212.1 hydrogenase [Mycobacterium intracellulare]MCA2262836.1 hydrogenase [Mycobacterium marseillense]MCA2303967.1 hydrogenase [Mycobacterium intracellulare]MCA2346752.1 hydrogenase [Mycobacterium intracellulare]
MMSLPAASHTVPTVFDGIANTVAVVVLLLEFGMLRAALLRSQVRLYAGQSLAVSVLAAVVAYGRDVPELYALAALSLLLKVVVVPLVVLALLRDARAEIAGSGAVGVANQVLVAIGVTAFGFFSVGVLGIHSAVLPTTALSLSVAVVLVAFVLMIMRRDVVSQAIGFFSLENGVSLASLVVAAGMPLILEVAFLFDLLVAVVVFGVLMRTHHRRTRSLSTDTLDQLRG